MHQRQFLEIIENEIILTKSYRDPTGGSSGVDIFLQIKKSHSEMEIIHYIYSQSVDINFLSF